MTPALTGPRPGAAPGPAAAGPGPGAGPGPARPVRVLVVDDQEPFREVVRQTLQEAGGFEVVAALPGTGTLTAEVDRLHPDLVLLDLRMPGEDGATAALRLRRTRPDLTVVLMSVFDVEDVPAEVFDAGIGFLPKEQLGPVPLAQVRDRLLGRAGPAGLAGPTVSDPTVSDPAVSDPAVSDPSVPDPAVSDPTASGGPASGGAASGGAATDAAP